MHRMGGEPKEGQPCARTPLLCLVLLDCECSGLQQQLCILFRNLSAFLLDN